MEEILYFPKLGLHFSLSRIAFSIGPINVYWYGILITLGFILGFGYVSLAARKLCVKVNDIIDPLVYSVFGGIIGARIYYVGFNFSSYKDNLLDVFKIWQGGIAIYGGIIGAFLVGIIICKIQKLKILRISDLVVGGLILGQAIGRWGNFVNIEAFGKNTDLPWGMTSQSIQRYLFFIKNSSPAGGSNIDPIGCVHPCFLYESIWCFLGFLIISFITVICKYDNKDQENDLEKKRINIYPGELTLIYFIWYGVGRFFIEGLRIDSLMFLGFRVSQALSLILVVISVIIFMLMRFINRKRSEKVFVNIDMNSAEDILKKFSYNEEE